MLPSGEIIHNFKPIDNKCEKNVAMQKNISYTNQNDL